MSRNIGYGKTIFFNEHFVVYGIPSIVSAVNLYTEASVERLEGKTGFEVIDNRIGSEGYSEKKKEHQKEALQRMIEKMGIDIEENPVKITVGGPLPTFSGLGASAALCVSIARALSDYFNMQLSDDEINDIAYEGEKGFAGNPSGVDNTAATYGGLLWFVRNDGKNTAEKIKISEPVEIVIGNTGVVANTKAVVEGVRERKETNPEKYDSIFREARDMANNARMALENGDIKKWGELMNKNHEILNEIEVSCDELNHLVDIARREGAWGAKMTGGGKGGCMVALTPGWELQEKVASAMEKEGFQVLRATVG